MENNKNESRYLLSPASKRGRFVDNSFVDANDAERDLQDFKQYTQSLEKIFSRLCAKKSFLEAQKLFHNFSNSLKAKIEISNSSQDLYAKHPLENELVLEKVMSYSNINDLLNFRLVSKFWNLIASDQLRNKAWVLLKNISTLEYPLYKNHSIAAFVNDINQHNNSTLFPMKKYRMDLFCVPTSEYEDRESSEYIFPETVTFENTFFRINNFHFITHINVSYRFTELFEENIPQHKILDSVVWIKPSWLPNLEYLDLHICLRQAFDIVIPRNDVFRNFKCLNLEISSFGTRENEDKLYQENSFVCDLLKSVPTMKSFSIWATPGRITVMQQTLDLLYTLDLKQLKDLSICQKSSVRSSTRIDLRRATAGTGQPTKKPPSFKLKSFSLFNTVGLNLHEFLKEHKNSLEILRICCAVILHSSNSDEFDQVLQLIPTLPNVHTITLNYYPRAEMNLGHLLTKKYFPNAKQLKLKVINVINWRVLIGEQEQQQQVSSIHNQIEDLIIDISDGLLTHKAEFLQSFSNLKTLSLICLATTFKTLLTTRSLSTTITSLILRSQDNNGNVACWDSILTGYRSADIHKVLNHIRNVHQEQISSSQCQSENVGNINIDLEKYNLNHEDEILMVKLPSIEYLQNLQKFEIHSEIKSRLRITEVTLVFLLTKFKHLTSINLNSCCVRSAFTTRIRKSLSPSFALELNGIGDVDPIIMEPVARRQLFVA